MKPKLTFRTTPMLDEFSFKKACDKILEDLDDIDMDKIHEKDPDVTIYDIVLDYFFEYKYKPVTQVVGWSEENMLPEYAYELKPEFAEQFKENWKDNDTTVTALYDLAIGDMYSFLDDIDYRFSINEYTDDPEELDEMINEYMFEKAMEED